MPSGGRNMGTGGMRKRATGDADGGPPAGCEVGDDGAAPRLKKSEGGCGSAGKNTHTHASD